MYSSDPDFGLQLLIRIRDFFFPVYYPLEIGKVLLFPLISAKATHKDALHSMFQPFFFFVVSLSQLSPSLLPNCPLVGPLNFLRFNGKIRNEVKQIYQPLFELFFHKIVDEISTCQN